MTLIVTWLWQGLAIAWSSAAVVRVLPRLNAATRHAIWWLALAAVLAIPVAHGLAAMLSSAPTGAGSTPLDVDFAGALILPAIPAGVIACAAAMWAITAALGLFRIVSSCRTLRRLKRESSPFDRSREAHLPMWLAARTANGRRRRTELRIHDEVTGAFALGLGHPVILVSRSVAGLLSDESLDEIVMHEQAHLDRYDDWSQLLLACLSCLAGLHPALRFLARRLSLDREAACDDRVVACTGAVRRYASALLIVAAASNSEAGDLEFAAAVPSATTTRSALRVRVGRLLDPRRAPGARVTRATRTIGATALAFAVVMLAHVDPVVIFLETSTLAATNLPLAPQTPSSPIASAVEAGLVIPQFRASAAPSNPPAQSDSHEVALPASPDTTRDTVPATPLDSRPISAVASAPVIAVPLPSSQPAVVQSALIRAAAPWEEISASANSTANDVAAAAVEAAAGARRTGVSIGRFFTRGGKAAAAVF